MFLFGQSKDQLPDLEHAGGVEAIGWFVEDQQVGIVYQGGAQAKTPRLCNNREFASLLLAADGNAKP